MIGVAGVLINDVLKTRFVCGFARSDLEMAHTSQLFQKFRTVEQIYTLKLIFLNLAHPYSSLVFWL